MPKSYYLSMALLDHITSNSAGFTQPANLYIGLLTAYPANPGGSYTEVTGGAYARVEINFGAASASGVSTNTLQINFPTATANWGTVVAMGIFDADTGGNLLSYDYLSSTRTVQTNDSLYFGAGSISWEES